MGRRALTRYMCLMMLSPNCEHPPSPSSAANAGWSAASHVINDILSEFAALDLRRALHEAGEVVSYAFAGDGAV